MAIVGNVRQWARRNININIIHIHIHNNSRVLAKKGSSQCNQEPRSAPLLPWHLWNICGNLLYVIFALWLLRLSLLHFESNKFKTSLPSGKHFFIPSTRVFLYYFHIFFRCALRQLRKKKDKTDESKKKLTHKILTGGVSCPCPAGAAPELWQLDAAPESAKRIFAGSLQPPPDGETFLRGFAWLSPDSGGSEQKI